VIIFLLQMVNQKADINIAIRLVPFATAVLI